MFTEARKIQLIEEVLKSSDDVALAMAEAILKNSGKKKKKPVSEKSTSRVRIIAKKPKFGSAKGMFRMMKNFDEPVTDFHEYMY